MLLSLCRLIVRPQRLAPVVAASNRRNLLLTPVCSRYPPDRAPPRPDSPLLRSILDSGSIDELHNVVKYNQRALSPYHVSACLLRLVDMVESQDSEFSPTESPLFQALSEKVIADLNSFTLSQVLDVVTFAGNLKVECSSPLVQVCCQVFAPRLEELDLRLLNTLSRALHQLRGTSALTESLMASSTKVFESQVEKLDLSDFKTCFRALDFALRVNLIVDKRDLVIDAARKLLSLAYPNYALGVIRAVAFERNHSLDPEDHKMHALLKDCLTVIGRNISLFESSQVQQLMTAYSKLNIVERELHDALWSLAPSWSLDEIKQLVSLIRAKDAFSSKDARTLLVLLEARGEKAADAQDTAETITEDLYRSVNQCKSREQLRDFIEQNWHGMDSQLLFRCICRCADLAMTEKGGFFAADDPFFEKLASLAASRLDSLGYHQCTILLKCAEQLELEDSHVLVQRVLREIPPLTPLIDLDQISILANRLRYIKGESPLKNDIMLALRLAFESQVGEKLDRTNEKQCLRALEFTLSEVSNFAVQDFVIDAAQGFLDQAAPIRAAQMIYSLKFNKFDVVTVENPNVWNLVQKCLTTLAKNLNEFDQETVGRIMTAYGKIDIFFEELNDAFWARAASLPFYEAVWIIFSLPTTKMRLKDAEHLKELLLANKDKVPDVNVLRCAHLMALLALSSPGVYGTSISIVRALHGNQRIPVQGPHTELGEIAPLLAEGLHRRPLPIVPPHVLVKFVNDLVVLGIFPEQHLDFLFSEENQRKFLSRGTDLIHLITLERLLRLRVGESCWYTVMPQLRKQAAVLRKSVFPDRDLVDSVRKILGGDQFFSVKVMTPIGDEADLIVAKGSDGNLVDLSGKKSPLEDLTEGTRVVGLLQCFRRRYHDDLETRELNFVQREHFLRAQNISPVVVNMVKWKSLPSRKERDSFLMRKIEDAMREAPPYKQQRFWKSP